MEEVANKRCRLRVAWIHRVEKLIEDVERWAKDLGWATRRIEKKLEDHEVGTHRVPALLLQEETCRMILEPIGRTAIGVDGVVDLYLMPAYDDISRIVHINGAWMLFPNFDQVDAGPVTSESPFLLTKEVLSRIFARTMQHAV